jgi:hypothetical protein
MVAKGAVSRRADAQAFLWTSAASGNPGMVALALTKCREVNMTYDGGAPLLSTAAAVSWTRTTFAARQSSTRRKSWSC